MQIHRRRDLLLAAAAPPAPARPNVIIILADDQGHGDLSAHGNPRLKTPHLDRLHSESIRLTNFHVAPMCTPTRAQLLTGRDALNTGAINVSSGRTLLRRDLPTLAGMFSASGYRTGIFGKWHLGDTYPYRPEDRGFQETVWFPSSHIGSTSDAWDNDYFDDRYRHNGKVEQYRGYCTDVFFGEAMKWMTSAKEPFFAYIPLNAPHSPLFVDDKYREPYRDLPRPLQSFFGMIANLDENVGKLEELLTKSGLRDNTIVIYFTDNGGTAGVNFFNSGMRGQKVTLWDGGHRVPCFVRWPKGGLQGGRDRGGLTQVQDLAPTLLDLCGVKASPAARFDGASLAPLLRTGIASPALAQRTIVVQFSRMGIGRPQYGDACVLSRQWRLLNGTDLYNIESDPAQASNVAGANPEIVARLRDHYDRWWARVSPRLDTFEPVFVGSPKENPVLLSPTEWADVFLDQGVQIRRAEPRNGLWHIFAERAGEYRFTLRRWPRDVDVPMRAALPAHRDRDAQYAAGKAMPIAEARFAAGLSIDQRQAVSAGQKEATFTVRLPEGPGKLQTWFYDASGRELSGAYFVYAEWTGA
jgi:arylsulfatase A-like enzyme